MFLISCHLQAQLFIFRELIPAEVLREAAGPTEQKSREGAEGQREEGNFCEG